MKRLSLLLLLLLVLGCAPKTIRGGAPTRGGSSGATAVTAVPKPKPPEPPKPVYLLPILLGDTRQQILAKLGTPDEVDSRPNNAVFDIYSYPILRWTYNIKPTAHYKLTVRFEGPMPPAKQKPITRAQQVDMEWERDYSDQTQELVTPHMVVPPEILSRKPDEFYGTRDFFDGSIDLLAVLWHLSSRVFLVEVTAPSARADKLFSDERKMNLQTNNLEYSHHLTASGIDWQNRKIRRFGQFDWNLSFRDSGVMSVGGPGYFAVTP